MIFRYLEPAVLTPRLLAGFLAMPFAAALSAYLMIPFLVQESKFVEGIGFVEVRHSDSLIKMASGVALYLFITAAVIVLVEAGPLFFWWQQQRRRVSFIATMLWAAVLGNTPLLLVVVITVVSRLLRRIPFGDFSWTSRTLVIGTTAGLLCGLAFWLIALHPWRRVTKAPRD